MAIYFFYPCAPDGSAGMFLAQECDDDEGALAHGRTVLAEHLSCVEVTVWELDRLVGSLPRGPED
ncbi:hypothetical protein [Brevundimonas vesicularis]|jgi:hypothetical protein|uniref:hypothetical protein n=1 Tax=Brevundimonas vesicularis TaxID=41276 RepID=UPI002898556E|nr:hypothetical protein [Brevundimonas vesicularis]